MSKPRALSTLLFSLFTLAFIPSNEANAQSSGLDLDGEFTFGLGPSYADLPERGDSGQLGLGGGAWLEYKFDNFWGLTSGLSTSYHFSDNENPNLPLPGTSIHTFWFGGLYTIDVAQFIPFFALAGTFYLSHPKLQDLEGNEVNAGVKGSFGADWRTAREWSIGAQADLHAFLTDLANYPVYLNVLVRFNYHFEVY